MREPIRRAAAGTRRLARRLRDGPAARRAARAWRWARATAVGRGVARFAVTDGQRDAGQLAFFVLMSVAPAILLLVAAFGLVVDDDEVQRQVVDLVLDNVPLDEESGRDELERALEQITRGAGQVTVVGSVVLLWSASGVMAALRHAINEAFATRDRRPFLAGKLVDVLLVVLLGALVIGSFALTFVRRVVEELAGDDRDLGGLVSFGLDVAANVVPILAAFLLLLGIYRWLPARHDDRRRAWPGALFATGLVVALQIGLRIYFSEFARLSIYGSVGGLIAILLVIYLSAIVIVLGAHVAAAASGVREGATGTAGRAG